MSKLNPQKATAYVGKGVLRKGGKITPVPNGPLIKKKGPFKGSTLKSGGTVKKAQKGTAIDKTSTGPKRNISKDIKAERTTASNKNKAIVDKYLNEAKDLRESAGTLFTMEAMNDNAKKDYSGVSALNKAAKTQDSLAKVAKKNPKYKPALKSGGMIKRADGSYSKRGLWDNIRKNKGSGKKPTKQMLVQEKKIKAKSKK